MNNKEKEMVVCLVENEIESDIDYLRDLKDKNEIEFYKEELILLKSLLNKLVTKK